MVEYNSNKNNAMQLFIVLLILIIFTMCCSLIYNKITDKFEPIKSDINGKNYNVRSQGEPEEKIKTANHLAEISDRVDKLVSYMYENNLPDPEIAKRLKKRWSGINFRETSQNESSAAYTVNKGDEMRLCVKNKGKMEEINTSMFVVLHELGHVMSISYGHNEEFRNNFSYIVHLASALGFYKPENFDNEPVEYCGTEINTTPCMSGMCEYTSIPMIGVEAFANTKGAFGGVNF